MLVWLSAAVAFVAAATNSITGFGYALIVMPVLTVAVGPKVAVVTMTAIGVPLVLFNAWRWRADLRGHTAAVLIVTSLVGTPLGSLLLSRADERVLSALVGVVVIVLTAALWRGLTLRAGRANLVAAGVASGALATSVGTNGPPIVIALRAEGLEPEPFRATLQVVFAAQGSIALATFWAGDLLSAEVGRAAMAGIPAAVLGALVGDRVAARVEADRFRVLVLVMLVASGFLAIASAITR